jgi:hypothetical protein
VLVAPARPAFLLSVVALLSSSALAVNFLLKSTEPVQIRLAPKAHGSAVAYAQLGDIQPFGHYPAMQGHYRDTRCFGGLLRIKALCHISDMYTILYVAYKALVYGDVVSTRPHLSHVW